MWIKKIISNLDYDPVKSGHVANVVGYGGYAVIETIGLNIFSRVARIYTNNKS